MQCSSSNRSVDVKEAPEPVKSFVKIILKEPNKLLNMHQYFPEIFQKSYLDCKMKNSEYLNEMISFIKFEFSDINIVEMFKWKEEFLGIKSVISVCPTTQNSLIDKNIFVYSISKNGAGLTLYWIKNASQYLLCYISFGYVLPQSPTLYE